MRKITCLLSIIIIFSFCKRKNIDAPPSGTLAEFPAHCYNSMIDSDELGTDCGGSCKPCKVAVPTCTQTSNQLTLGPGNYTLTNANCGNLYNANSYDFRGSYAGGTFTVRVSGSLPEVSKSYPIDIKISPNANEACSLINSFSLGNMASTTGTVFISQNAGKYTVTVCSASYYSFVTSQSYPGVINVTCQ